MSYPVLNSSIHWKLEDYKTTPRFHSAPQPNAAGRGNAAASMMPFPVWDFNVVLPANVSSILTTSSIISQFFGTFGLCQGQGGLFLYDDVTDDTVTTACSGMLDNVSTSADYMTTTVNGTSTEFQLVRTLGGLAWDIIQNLNGSIDVYVNGTLKTLGTDYSVSDGVVTFASAPAASAALTWSGKFYFLCRFGADSFTGLSMIGYNSTGALWTCEDIKFSSEFV